MALTSKHVQQFEAALPHSATRSPGPGSLRPFRVLFDERYEACRSFAASARRLGCGTQSIAGDVTAVWFNDLEASWARGEGTMFGMTTRSSLFCLEQLASNHWMRVTARIEHRAEPQGAVRHQLHSPEPTLQQAASVLATDADWPARLAAPLLEGLRDARGERRAASIVVTNSSVPDASRVSLVTWTISAPEARQAQV